ARAALELLQRREAGNEALQPALRTMDRSFVAALQTIDRFVDAQRIVDGTVKLQIGPLELTSIVEQAIALARPMLAERGQRVTKNLDGDPIVVSDSTRSAQVLAQLIENASVNAPEGAAIELEASASGEQVDVIVRVLASEASARAPQRILLVDDNQAVRNIYREALEELGYDVTLASNGEDALRAVEGSVPEVALIDVHLPTLNGYQVARALRARHPSSRIKLLMLSGMTLDADLVRLSTN